MLSANLDSLSALLNTKACSPPKKLSPIPLSRSPAGGVALRARELQVTPRCPPPRRQAEHREPSSAEMRRARLGALRMDMEELSTDISVNGIVDHLVVDLSRKVLGTPGLRSSSAVLLGFSVAAAALSFGNFG